MSKKTLFFSLALICSFQLITPLKTSDNHEQSKPNHSTSTASSLISNLSGTTSAQTSSETTTTKDSPFSTSVISFDSLPTDIHGVVADFLPSRDLVVLERVNLKLSKIALPILLKRGKAGAIEWQTEVDKASKDKPEWKKLALECEAAKKAYRQLKWNVGNFKVSPNLYQPLIQLAGQGAKRAQYKLINLLFFDIANRSNFELQIESYLNTLTQSLSAQAIQSEVYAYKFAKVLFLEHVSTKKPMSPQFKPLIEQLKAKRHGKAFYLDYLHHPNRDINLLTEAAKLGYAGAQYYLQVHLEKEGKNDEAIEWYCKAAEQGHANTRYYLGVHLEKEGKNDEAIGWYRKAAEQDHAFSQVQFGNLLFEEGKIPEAIEWYCKAAETGHFSAMEWLRKTAEKGNADAQYHLGLFLEKDCTIQEAIEWYRKAVVQGHVNAKPRLLSLLAKEGKIQKPVEWYREKTQQDDADAQYHLAVLLEIEGKTLEAMECYRKAAKLGNGKAQTQLWMLLEIESKRQRKKVRHKGSWYGFSK